MAGEPRGLTGDIGERVADFQNRAERLSPLDIHARMDAIRQAAAENGLDALEGLAYRSAQLALLPGHRIATQCCCDRLDDALGSRSQADRTAILAAIAARLH